MPPKGWKKPVKPVESPVEAPINPALYKVIYPNIIWTPFNAPFDVSSGTVEEEPRVAGVPTWRESNYLADPSCDFVPLVRQHLVIKAQIKSLESKLSDIRGGIKMHLELAGAEMGITKKTLSPENRVVFTVGDASVSLVKSVRHPLNTDKLKQHLLIAGLDPDVIATCFSKSTDEKISYFPEVRRIKEEKEGDIEVGGAA